MAIHAKKEKEMSRVFIIAEAGVNHNGSLKVAKKMVDVAAQAGVDAIKFQTFQAQSLVSKFAPKALYQKRTTGRDESQLEMIKKLELDLNAHKELIKYCRTKKINFLSSAFDLESIDLLARLGLRIFKVPSGEITNLPYLRKIGSLRKKVILSTGMSTLAEVKGALHVLVRNGTKKENITVLHCTTEYPTPIKDVNLLAMQTMRDRLGVKVGYSDHTLGIEATAAAVALGATVIEKHFTFDKKMAGPDHQASVEGDELRLMVKMIRNVEKSIGSGVKAMLPSERKNKNIVRKSIVAARSIQRGETFVEENITTKRPGSGISPMLWDRVLGKRAKRNFGKDELIRL